MRPSAFDAQRTERRNLSRSIILPLMMDKRLKWAFILLKILLYGGSYFISLWFYALFWGWKFALVIIVMIFAHEMGHYVLNHGAKITMSLTIFIFVGFGLAAVIFNRVIKKRGPSWGVNGIADPAGFPLLMLIFATYAFLLTPIANTMSRTIEREADIFGLNAAREPDAAAIVALKLGKYRKMEPTPLEEFIFFDHPSGRNRIRMAMDWRAANLPAGELPAMKTTAHPDSQ